MSKLIFSVFIFIFFTSALSCDKTQLAFLSVQIPNLDSLKDAADFAMGFDSGLEILRLPSQDNCFNHFFDKEYVNKILHLTDLIKSIDCDTDLSQLFNQILNDVVDVYKMIKVTDGECLKWRIDVSAKLQKVVDYLKTDKFLEKLLLHTAFHFNQFKPFLTSGIEYFKNGDYFNSGFNFGGFLKQLLFWEFKN